MSLDANLFDLDDKIIYDISGGRHLWWLLPRVEGHRIIVTHDNNSCMDYEEEDYFRSLGYKEVDCDKLFRTLDINFSMIPDNFYSIRTSLVYLAYGITFDMETLGSGSGFNLECGLDKESDYYWFKCKSVTDLVNCCPNLYAVCLSNYCNSVYGENLQYQEFVEELKEFGLSVDNYVETNNDKVLRAVNLDDSINDSNLFRIRLGL